MCDNSNESHLRALSCGGVFRAMQSGSKFSVCVRELVCMNLRFKRKLKSHFHTVLTFKAFDESLPYVYSAQCYRF